MFETSHLMLEGELVILILRIHDIFETKLMIAHVFGNQAATLQVAIRCGKICDVNGNMVSVVWRNRLVCLAESERLVSADLDQPKRALLVLCAPHRSA